MELKSKRERREIKRQRDKKAKPDRAVFWVQ